MQKMSTIANNRDIEIVQIKILLKNNIQGYIQAISRALK